MARSIGLIAGPFVAAALFASATSATPNFPGALESDLTLSYTPDCTLCHAGGMTQAGTVTLPFGVALRARGLVAYDESSLARALDQLAKDKVDSDGDGVTDLDALKAGKDPNGALGSSATPVQYGCALSGARGSDAPTATRLLLAALVLVRRTRRLRSRD